MPARGAARVVLPRHRSLRPLLLASVVALGALLVGDTVAARSKRSRSASASSSSASSSSVHRAPSRSGASRSSSSSSRSSSSSVHRAPSRSSSSRSSSSASSSGSSVHRAPPSGPVPFVHRAPPHSDSVVHRAPAYSGSAPSTSTGRSSGRVRRGSSRDRVRHSRTARGSGVRIGWGAGAVGWWDGSVDAVLLAADETAYYVDHEVVEAAPAPLPTAPVEPFVVTSPRTRSTFTIRLGVPLAHIEGLPGVPQARVSGCGIEAGFRTAPLGCGACMALEGALGASYRSNFRDAENYHDAFTLGTIYADTRLYLFPTSIVQPFIQVGGGIYVLDSVIDGSGLGVRAGGGLQLWWNEHIPLEATLTYEQVTVRPDDRAEREQTASGLTGALSLSLYF